MIYIGLGGNVGGDEAIIARFRQARDQVCAAGWGERGWRVSGLYRTAPIGMTAQAPFLNAVLEVAAAVDPRRALADLQRIENELGRVRIGAGWGPRTIDLDLLMADRAMIKSAGLVLPHPRLHERAFVLRPLADLVGTDLRIPGLGRTVGECLADAGDQQVTACFPAPPAGAAGWLDGGPAR
jgi:2-amino-4-hydroxy-6-hydroxymethyldihydropteridine diphosphokinase